MQKVHLIMPMGGAGIRFSQSVGFDVPKPLIPLRNKPFLYWATKAVTERMPVSKLSFIVLKDHVEQYSIDEVIHSYFPDAGIAVLEKQLNGPVLTCLEGVKQLNVADDECLIFNDCDHVFRSHDLERHLMNDVPSSGLVTFKSSEPQFSYVKYDASGKIIGTVEKQVVSNDAICGAYVFKNKSSFLNAANTYIREGLGSYKEFFVSGLYNILPRNENVKLFRADEHLSFGTPEEYEATNRQESAGFFLDLEG